MQKLRAVYRTEQTDNLTINFIGKKKKPKGKWEKIVVERKEIKKQRGIWNRFHLAWNGQRFSDNSSMDKLHEQFPHEFWEIVEFFEGGWA